MTPEDVRPRPSGSLSFTNGSLPSSARTGPRTMPTSKKGRGNLDSLDTSQGFG